MKTHRLVVAALTCAVIAAALALVAGALGDGSAKAAPAAPSAEVGRLTIDDLAGASGLEVQSYSWGVENPVTIGGPGGGGGAGKATFSDLVVERPLDDVTPALVEAVATGEHFPSATLVAKAGKGTMRYTLDEVFVTSVEHSTSGERPLERLSLTYEAVELESAP
jgi:type VI secretion system secreted protein Hcp